MPKFNLISVIFSVIMKIYYLIVYCVDSHPYAVLPRLFLTFEQAKSYADFSLKHKNFYHTESYNNFFIKSITLDLTHDLPF